MAGDISFGSLETDAPALEAPGWDTPFRFAILGDFSGRANRDATESPEEVAQRSSKKIDRENFDEVLAELEPRLELKLKEGSVELTFASLDDFHPDYLVSKVELFDDCSNVKEKSALLSAILHHTDFQSLEAAWLGLDWFLKKSWTGDNGVEIVLYDLALAELKDGLNADDDLSHSPPYHWLVEKALNGYNAQPWGAIIGLYSFPVNAESVQILGRMAKVARHASAPFLAGLGSAVWEKTYKPAKNDVAAWESLRKLPEAAMLGLATPGFLLRPPYGSGTKPIEAFAFEEYRTVKDQAFYLWGNPALACGALLAKSFTKKNWSFKPGADLNLDQMSMHVARDVDDEEILITVQAWHVAKTVDQLTKQGFMTLQGVKKQPQIQLSRFLPLAQAPVDQPAADLIGSWGQKALKGVPRTPTKMAVGGSSASLAADTGMTEEAKGKRGKGKAADLVGSGGSSKKGRGGKSFDLDNLDDLDSAVDAFEAKRKADQEALEAANNPPPEESSDSSSDSSSSDMDAEMAALMGSSDTPSEETPSETPSEEMDPELAALMASMESETPNEPAAEEAMDPELAELLKQMDGG